MPIIRIPTAHPDMDEAVELIEQTQRIVSVTAVGPGAALVVTEPLRPAQAKETRAK